MDNLTPEQRRKNMQNIRSEGTRPELLIAKELRRRKIYCAKNAKTITGKPDFVFRRKKVAVFVYSDFWHGHRTRCVMPKSNCEYWDQKIARNKERDKQVTKALKKSGWTVIRLWEYDLKHNFLKEFSKIFNAVSICKDIS